MELNKASPSLTQGNVESGWMWSFLRFGWVLNFLNSDWFP